MYVCVCLPVWELKASVSRSPIGTIVSILSRLHKNLTLLNFGWLVGPFTLEYSLIQGLSSTPTETEAILHVCMCIYILWIYCAWYAWCKCHVGRQAGKIYIAPHTHAHIYIFIYIYYFIQAIQRKRIFVSKQNSLLTILEQHPVVSVLMKQKSYRLYTHISLSLSLSLSVCLIV